HRLLSQIFTAGNEVAFRNRRRKRGYCQKTAATISTVLLPETAILVAEICFCSSE
ncbi:hypothetical protein Tco_1150486, partial [Tanacetum coccineum]